MGTKMTLIPMHMTITVIECMSLISTLTQWLTANSC